MHSAYKTFPIIPRNSRHKNQINKNVSVVEKDVAILKEQTLALNDIVQKIKLNISLTKMEAFESIVSQKPVANNTNYLNALLNTKNLLSSLDITINGCVRLFVPATLEPL